MGERMTEINLYSKNQIDSKMPKTLNPNVLVAGTVGYEWTPFDFNGAICQIIIDTTSILTDVTKVNITGFITGPDTNEYIGSINVLDNSVAKIVRLRNENYSNNKITIILDIDGTDISPANYSISIIYQDMYQ